MTTEPLPRPVHAAQEAELTVIIVSYNTRDLTLKALETLYETTLKTRFHTVVFDNDSQDGSVEAIAEAFPQVELIASKENLGFARANNLVAAQAKTEWLLLLNPDTECHAGAVDNLLAFSKSNPQAGITGGRTVFPDGSLNAASCWMRITPWSAFCKAAGLAGIFKNSSLFNQEGIGGWQRDSVREVDIVVGCFFMIPRALWDQLEGFNLKYFMYGEEADLCLRALELGYKPMITPDAQIMHLIGAASKQQSRRYVLSAKGRMTLMQDHWPTWQVPFGRATLAAWAGSRALGMGLIAKLTGKKAAVAQKWAEIWAARRDWLKGY